MIVAIFATGTFSLLVVAYLGTLSFVKGLVEYASEEERAEENRHPEIEALLAEREILRARRAEAAESLIFKGGHRFFNVDGVAKCDKDLIDVEKRIAAAKLRLYGEDSAVHS